MKIQRKATKRKHAPHSGATNVSQFAVELGKNAKNNQKVGGYGPV